jgi:hypothetical protein
MPATHEAYITDSLFEEGLGHVYVLRKKSPQKMEAGVFLIDPYCLGVRDAFFYEGTEADVRERIETNPYPLSQKPADYVRTLIEESIAYAKKLGFGPHKDYKKAARVLGGLKASGDLKGFNFGKDGKPYYGQSQYHSEDDARRIVAKLTRICGEDGFHYLLKIGESDEYEDGIEERIVLYEGWLDGLTPEREALLVNGPSEAAKRCYLDFAGQEQFAGDPIFHNPIWAYPDEPGTFGLLLEAVQAILEAAPKDLPKDPNELKEMMFTIFIIFANFQGEDEAFVEKQFESMVRKSDIEKSFIPFLRALYYSDETQEFLDEVMHPEPGLGILPMINLKIDDASSHYVLVCLEKYGPDEVEIL